ncbi:MAG: hypothetical protein ACXVXL_30670 [Solirubrobacteraceae bacterium]
MTAAVEFAREHDEVPVVIEQVRLATLALTQAAAAISEDRMLVPDRLAKSLRHLLVVYVIAERLNGATATRSRQGAMHSNCINLPWWAVPVDAHGAATSPLRRPLPAPDARSPILRQF